MALLATANVEVGTLGEFFANAGTVAASQVQAHMGTWSVRANPAAATGTVSLRPPSGDMARTALTIYVIWYRIATLPAAGVKIASVQSSLPAEVAAISVDNTGAVTGVGTGSSATVATVPLNTWFACVLQVLSNGTSSLSIDGRGGPQTFTANNVTQDRIVLGATSASTMDIFIDDISIYDSAWTAGTTSPHFSLPMLTLAAPSSVTFGRGRWTQ